MSEAEQTAEISTAEIVNGLKNTYDIFAANFARGSGKSGMRMEIVQSIAFAIVRLERLETENAALRAQANEPLTEDQIRSMKEKPVFVVFKSGREPRWFIVGQMLGVDLFLTGYGENWVAYAHEPEGAHK